MKLGVTLDILNQKGTPAFYADTLANRPAAGFEGRVFISTDTFDLYRDTGSTWVLLSPSGGGGISGSGTTNTLPLFTGSTILGDSALTQQAGISITIGSFATPYDFIGYGNNYANKFIKNGASPNDLLAGDGNVITAGTGITISGGVISSSGGGGGISGSGSIGQVSYFNGSTSITGDNNFFWDSLQGFLGIGTFAPIAVVDVNGNTPLPLISVNQLNSTFDSILDFKHAGGNRWRIGTLYNLGLYSFGIYDTLSGVNRFSIYNTGQTFIGQDILSSGLFVVNSFNPDDHIVVIGANAPSIRVRTSGTAAINQFGLGLATTVNNFIQGTTGGEFCIFNDSVSPSPIVFGINNFGLVNEVARLSSAFNFLVGSPVDTGEKFQLSGSIRVNGQTSLTSSGNSGNHLIVNCDGILYKIKLENF